MIRPYYRGAAGILLVYDVTDPRTFENVKDWLRSIEENISECQIIQKILVGEFSPRFIYSLVIIAVFFSIGNKIDLDAPQISTSAGKALASRHKLPFFEVSAKNGSNLEEAFKHLTKMVLEAQKSAPVIQTDRKKASVTLDTIPIHPREEKGCCLTS